MATHEEEEERQHKTLSSSKSGSPEGDQGLNKQAYEGSDDGDGGGGEDNIIVYDPLHGGQSEPSGGYGGNKGNEPSEDNGHAHQMASSPWLTDSDNSYGYGQQYYGHSHHVPSYEYRQQYGGQGGPSHGYGQQQYGILIVPPQVQQPPPQAYPQVMASFILILLNTIVKIKKKTTMKMYNLQGIQSGIKFENNELRYGF